MAARGCGVCRDRKKEPADSTTVERRQEKEWEAVSRRKRGTIYFIIISNNSWSRAYVKRPNAASASWRLVLRRVRSSSSKLKTAAGTNTNDHAKTHT